MGAKIALQMQNNILGTIVRLREALKNQFENIEACRICFCLLHPQTQTIPNSECQNCRNKSHLKCVQDWFKQSGKSECPLCKTNYF